MTEELPWAIEAKKAMKYVPVHCLVVWVAVLVAVLVVIANR